MRINKIREGGKFRGPARSRARRRVEDSGCPVNLLSGENSNSEESGKHRLLLEPYGYRWFRVGALDYTLKRSEI